MPEHHRNFARDQRGNVLPITAAIIIPLVGLVGAGVDISRAYLVKNRLQQACDAGVLAGRKVLTTGVDTTVTNEVRKYVNFNFPQRTMDSAPFTIQPTDGTDRAVDLTLSTSVPTIIMKILGATTIPVSVTCRGRQDFVNTDVMMVLDTTLSMNCAPSDSATTYCTTEKSNAKIKGLRSAVASFYRTLKPAQDRLEASGLRLRYGIVPYSMTVNTGKLVYAVNSSYIKTTANYQKCTRNSNGDCTSYTYNPVTFSSSWLTSTWPGCIEERSTVTTIGSSSSYTIPTGAYDLDVDTAPSSEATKWAPYVPAEVTAKDGLAGIDQACPKSATRLTRFAAESDMTSWMSTMTAGGYTYHDVGLTWGARLFSPTGLWSSDNPSVFNTFPVNRHLIFMTDGAMDPDLLAYSAWGVESYSTGGRRVSGNGNATTQLNSHQQRFRMMCNKIKSMNISIWVIAFGESSGTGLSTDLRNCASSPAQAFRAADSASLNSYFQQIGESIGALRLTQ